MKESVSAFNDFKMHTSDCETRKYDSPSFQPLPSLLNIEWTKRSRSQLLNLGFPYASVLLEGLPRKVE